MEAERVIDGIRPHVDRGAVPGGHGNIFGLRCVRGPEGIIVELAERIG